MKKVKKKISLQTLKQQALERAATKLLNADDKYSRFKELVSKKKNIYKKSK